MVCHRASAVGSLGRALRIRSTCGPTPASVRQSNDHGVPRWLPAMGKTVVCKSVGCGKGSPRSDNLGIGVGHTAAGCNFGVDTYPQPAGHSCSQSTALARPNNNSVESRHTGLVSGAGSPPTRKASCEVEFGEPARSNRSAVGDEARRYAGVPGPVPV